MRTAVDDDFTTLPLGTLADAALDKARSLGATYAALRVERVREQAIRLRDGRLEGSNESTDLGLSVRVVHDGCWGFASGADLTPDSAATLAEQAVALARVSAPLATDRVVLADEPVASDGSWVSDYDVDPFSVDDADKIALLTGWSERLLAGAAVDHVDASVRAVKEQKFYADLAGTRTVQQRVRIEPEVTVVGVNPDGSGFDTLTTTAPPAGRGWEYTTGTGWDWDDELGQLPDQLAERLVAPSVEAGRYDLVIHPSNLWLTIHESIGHATELDRALGYEANYAGTSFATFDQLGSLHYGSPLLNIVGDRVVPHGLSTVGWDDEGVAGQQWDLVRGGTLVGYQLDRAMAEQKGLGRSNGCAFADSPAHVPIQRMANVSLEAAPNGPGLDALIGGVEDGLYVVGDKSWSIDMQRYNFQFTGQRFYRIRAGKLVGQVKDAAYQATTTDFWSSMVAVGGPETYLLAGAFNCGKGQPGQVAAVSHGAPVGVFEGVNILNTTSEAGR